MHPHWKRYFLFWCIFLPALYIVGYFLTLPKFDSSTEGKILSSREGPNTSNAVPYYIYEVTFHAWNKEIHFSDSELLGYHGSFPIMYQSKEPGIFKIGKLNEGFTNFLEVATGFVVFGMAFSALAVYTISKKKR